MPPFSVHLHVEEWCLLKQKLFLVHALFHFPITLMASIGVRQESPM